MKVILSKSNTVSSWAIRAFTWSSWSHCGILDGEYVIESTAKDGVVRTHFDDFIAKYSSHKIITVPHKDGYKERLVEHLGKGYDWGAIYGLVLRSDWSNYNKWFCSELVAYVSGVFRKDATKRVTPQHIYMIGSDS